MGGEPLVLLWRTIFFYFFLLLMVRITGKHSVGRLSPFDFVVTIMLAEAAALAIENSNMSLLTGIIPIATLVALEILLSYASVRLPFIHRVIKGQPTVVIRHGQIDEQALRRLRFNLSDLLEELRSNQVPNVSDVEYAIWEPSGQLTVVPKASQQPLRPLDVGQSGSDGGLPLTLITDGRYNRPGLEAANIVPHQLERLLRNEGFDTPRDIFLATVDNNDDLRIQLRRQAGGRRIQRRIQRPPG